MIDCSIVIVSWNVRDLLRSCLRSIERAPKRFTYEVIVVDNGSTDGTVDMLRAEFPQVTLIAAGKNLGFARANNRALGVAKGRLVLFLNPDTEIIENALDRLVESLDTHPKAAIAAPQIVNPDGTFQKGSVRRDPTLASLVIILMKVQRAIASHPVLQQYYATDFEPSQTQDIEQPMGAALMVRRDSLKRHGAFDEGFFLWFEEVDLCKRYRDAGNTIRYEPDARIIHHGGKSFEQQLPLAKQRIYNHSVTRYARKHLGLPALLVIYSTMPFNMIMVSAYHLFKRIRSYAR